MRRAMINDRDPDHEYDFGWGDGPRDPRMTKAQIATATALLVDIVREYPGRATWKIQEHLAHEHEARLYLHPEQIVRLLRKAGVTPVRDPGGSNTWTLPADWPETADVLAATDHPLDRWEVTRPEA